MTAGPFSEAMAARTDVQLLEVLHATEGTWREEARSAARAELTKRGLPVPTREEAQHTRTLIDASRATQPLENGWVLRSLWTPLLLMLAHARQFERDGYHLKAKTLRSITWWSFVLFWAGGFTIRFLYRAFR